MIFILCEEFLYTVAAYIPFCSTILFIFKLILIYPNNKVRFY